MASLRSLYTQLFPPKPVLTEKNVTSQRGKVFIVTGGNSGVGFELCKILYGTGATIYMASRSEERATNAIKQITNPETPPTSPGQLKFLQLDLNDLTSVRSAASTFAAQEPQLHALWNNAGMGPYRIEAQAKTAQGLEALVGMHCVATLLFTQLLEPQLRAAADAATVPGSVRVVWTSSISDQDAPRNGIEFDRLEHGTEDRIRNYSVSKVGSWMLGREMARRYASKGIVSVTINPGNVKAGSYDGMPGHIMLFLNMFLHETQFGAYTGLYAGLSPEITPEHNGSYIIPWGRIRPDSASPRQDIIKAMTPEEEGGLGYCVKFWDWCEEQYSKA
ncbi:hypothetical protein B0T10DRAFT_401387 [Thelonectria olida]|uniref:NAD(P)-binding protein n=1 Tax=Thelonectria olida TaxID=1576542 RepID=A0A9P9AS82_9HYPO|nr:hypothetical protein B0T10DRAFT_401387 [Thelonectria olida]